MTAAVTVSVCSRCGTTVKSGKMSCCGRGGSWFKNCGGVGNMKYHHTWYEGIQACKTRSQSKTVIGNQQNGAQQEDTGSSEGAGMTNYRAVIAATETFVFTSANTSTPMPDTISIVMSTRTSASKAISTQRDVYVLTITFYMFFIACLFI